MKQIIKKYIKEEPTILELLPYVEWKKVKLALQYYYPDLKVGSNYKSIFEGLKTFKKRKHKDTDEKLEIDAVNDAIYYEDKDMWGEWYSIATNKFGLSFRKWQELANIPLSKETIKHYTFTNIFAHFIWEITWYGNEEESLKKGKELKKRVKEIEKK